MAITLLQRAQDFYAALVSENVLHAPSVIMFRAYMVQHFTDAGMRAADEVDNAKREGRAWPLLVVDPNKPKPAQPSAPAYAEGYGPQGKIYKSFRETSKAKTEAAKAPVKSNAAPFKTMDISKGRSEAAPNQGNTQPISDLPAQPISEPTTDAESEKVADVAVVKAISESDIERIKTMQNSAIAQEWSRDALVEYMHRNNIEYNPTAKPKQLAATLALHLKNA